MEKLTSSINLPVDSFTCEPDAEVSEPVPPVSPFLFTMLRALRGKNTQEFSSQSQHLKKILWDCIKYILVSLLEKFLVASIVVRMAPLSFRRALNFLRQSTVSCRCTRLATRSRCCEQN